MRYIVEPMSPGEQQLTQRIKRTRCRGEGFNWIGLVITVALVLLVALAGGLGDMAAGTEFIP